MCKFMNETKIGLKFQNGTWVETNLKLVSEKYFRSEYRTWVHNNLFCPAIKSVSHDTEKCFLRVNAKNWKC